MKLNPNQFALPGMEDLSPLPNAAHSLTKGVHFNELEPGSITAHMTNETTPNNHDQMPEAALYWNHTNAPLYDPSEIDPIRRGEIGWISRPGHMAGTGVATAMYEIARTGQLGRKARHSPNRTSQGDVWARSDRVRALGGQLPKLRD